VTPAGREVLRLQRRYLAEARSFAVETTLSGIAILRLMEDASGRGFSIHLLYIGLENVQIAVDRIAVRVARGGHDIPTADVRRRYGRSLGHLHAAIKRSDHVRLIDNTAEAAPREVLVIDNGQVRVRATDLPLWVHAALGPLSSPDVAQWQAPADRVSVEQPKNEE
jgi:predicted ABC-type ATPase